MLYRNRRISPSNRVIAFSSAESTNRFDTRSRSLSASASICVVETFRVFPMVDTRTLIHTVFLATSNPGSAIATVHGTRLLLSAAGSVKLLSISTWGGGERGKEMASGWYWFGERACWADRRRTAQAPRNPDAS